MAGLEKKDTGSTSRKATYSVDEFILQRWSPRAMSGETLTDQELFSLFEAARWAPSSYNNQPWRFIYAKRETVQWDLFFNLMVPFNQEWAKNAAVLVVIVSRDTFAYNNQPSRTHSFDTGAAWENLSLQGFINGLVVHGMEGFDYDRAKRELKILDGYTVEAMCAIGKLGNKEDLPEAMREREVLTDRKSLEEIVFDGVFKVE